MNALLNDERLYYVGGYVRDEILGIKSHDIDITFQGNAIDFCKKLEKEKIGVIKQINKNFGTVRMVINNKVIDFASTRDEIYEKKGHLPQVTALGCELKKDVLRRDFTVNSLAKSLKTGEIIDYTGGLNDLKNKKLKVLHDNSFVDDPTRIIRGLKFSIRYGFRLDEHTKELQNQYLSNVNYDMSYKRLKKEITETFNLNSQRAYNEFFSQNMYKLLSDKTAEPPDYNIEKLINKIPVDNIWLVYLGWYDLSKIPLNKNEQKILDDFNILKTLEIKEDNFSLYKAFENKKPESVLLYTITEKSQKGLKYLKIKDTHLSITGEDLKKMNIPPSKKYGECFDYILKIKLEGNNLSRSNEIELARNFFKTDISF